MAHAQQQVLDAIRAALLAGGTVAGSRVFLDRDDTPLQPGELPALLINEGDDGESSETDDIDGSEFRTLSVVIDCILSPASDSAAEARAFGLAVEKIVSPDAALRLLARDGPRITSSRLIQRGDGDRFLSCRRQTWLVGYCVNPATPDVIF